VLLPVAFLRRLAALVPPPGVHLVRFSGVLVPNARLRPLVVPRPPPPPEPLSAEQPSTVRPSCIPWAQLLKRTAAPAGWWPASSAPASPPASSTTSASRPGRFLWPAPRTFHSSSCTPDATGWLDHHPRPGPRLLVEHDGVCPHLLLQVRPLPPMHPMTRVSAASPPPRRHGPRASPAERALLCHRTSR